MTASTSRRRPVRLVFARALAVPLAPGAFAPPAFAADTDGDGMPNLWEKNNGLKPLVKGAGKDPDSDGLTNIQELNKKTKSLVADADGDGLEDYWGWDPHEPDTDGNGVLDGNEDPDGDTILDKDDDVDGSDPWEVDENSVECEESLVE